MTLPVPYYDQDGITIYHGDCREILPHLEPVDLVLTDPPYALSFKGNNGDTPQMLGHVDRQAGREMRGGLHYGPGTNSRGYADNDPAKFQQWFTDVALAIFVALSPGAHLVAFGGARSWHRMAVAIEDAGFEYRDTLMWLYATGQVRSRALFKPAWEPIVVGRKHGPSREINVDGLGRYPSNVLLEESVALHHDWSRYFYCPKASRRERGEGNTHPSVKPLSLMRWLVARLAPPTGAILDPFMGSGSTLLAAASLGHRAIGVEMEERYCEIAVKRLQQSALPLGV